MHCNNSSDPTLMVFCVRASIRFFKYQLRLVLGIKFPSYEEIILVSKSVEMYYENQSVSSQESERYEVLGR